MCHQLIRNHYVQNVSKYKGCVDHQGNDTDHKSVITHKDC